MFGARSASSWLRSCAAATELQPDRYRAHSVLSEGCEPLISRQDVPSRYRFGCAASCSALPRERFSRVLGMLSSLEVKVLYPTGWRGRVSDNARAIVARRGLKEAYSKRASRWTNIGYKARASDERATYREVHIHQGCEA